MPASLHIITDTVLQQKFSHAELARMAWEGGADVVQFREKRFHAYHRLRLAEEIAALPRQKKQKLIINDFPQIAALSGADGVHLGSSDWEPEKARIFLGDKAIIGATVHNENELIALEGTHIDYIGVGPVFGTKSKDTGLPELSLKGLEAICKKSTWPVIAIGSVTLENVKEVIAAGAWGVAVLSHFCLAENPVDVAKKFREILG